MADTVRNLNARPDRVPIDSITPHPRNVNEGDVGAIHTSITKNGWFGRVLVQQSTGWIIAGKYRWLAAQEAGMTEVDIEWVDVDDEAAVRVMLADNRLSRIGRDDDQALADLLTELAATDRGLLGTGFDGDDLDDLTRLLDRDDLDALAAEYGAPDGTEGNIKIVLDVDRATADAWANWRANYPDDTSALTSLLP